MCMLLHGTLWGTQKEIMKQKQRWKEPDGVAWLESNQSSPRNDMRKMQKEVESQEEQENNPNGDAESLQSRPGRAPEAAR